MRISDDNEGMTIGRRISRPNYVFRRASGTRFPPVCPVTRYGTIERPPPTTENRKTLDNGPPSAGRAGK